MCDARHLRLAGSVGRLYAEAIEDRGNITRDIARVEVCRQIAFALRPFETFANLRFAPLAPFDKRAFDSLCFMASRERPIYRETATRIPLSRSCES